MNIKAKIIGAAFLILVAIIMGLVVSNAIKDKRMRNLSERLDTVLVEINNLKVKEKANVAANKQKAELEKTIEKISADKDVGAEDRANLTYVPNDAILMQLQSDPF